MSLLPLFAMVALISFACRALPLVLLSGRPAGPRAATYLRHLPLGVLAAMAAVAIWPHGRGLEWPVIAGAGAAVLLAVRSGNLLVTLLGAMAVAAALRAL